ncbi:MAG: hypothetical protein M1829_006248 [Trizodia sp. TS-e1964]|nr:MAG: hypothetical protein M1829_006248 [Trizodia sp. TS-e1964]
MGELVTMLPKLPVNVSCPVCNKTVLDLYINQHLDSNCTSDILHNAQPGPAATFQAPPLAPQPSFEPVSLEPAQLRAQANARQSQQGSQENLRYSYQNDLEQQYQEVPKHPYQELTPSQPNLTEKQDDRHPGAKRQILGNQRPSQAGEITPSKHDNQLPESSLFVSPATSPHEFRPYPAKHQSQQTPQTKPPEQQPHFQQNSSGPSGTPSQPPTTPAARGPSFTHAASQRRSTGGSGIKRSFDDGPGPVTIIDDDSSNGVENNATPLPTFLPGPKRTRQTPRGDRSQRIAPLADRMRPLKLDDIVGQEIIGPNGVLRGLIEADRLPSLLLWGASGTGKTTIARLIARLVACRFVEINSTMSGVAEIKKIFAEARGEQALTGRKTIVFCDEIHRFSKTQQDVFLGPVESGQITLIGATTENPSFKIQSALLSRCRTLTLEKLTSEHIAVIMNRALVASRETYQASELIDQEMLKYLAAFSDGDARIGLNLLEIAMDLSSRPGMTLARIKKSLVQTLVYDRAGDQHYDTISAFHKSIRGSDPDAALYYLGRMLQSGEDPLFIARRLVVIASEDIGLADNSMLALATAGYTAAEKVGMPEARINLAHVTTALALSKKSTRAYRGFTAVMHAIEQPGVAGLPVPVHLRNAPTRLLREMGHGRDYKYNPDYLEGEVVQEYLPAELKGTKFLDDNDLGSKVDPDLERKYDL